MRDASIAIIFDSVSGGLLLVQRKDVPVWVCPGGGIDPGETAEEAVVREVREETGLQVSIRRKLATLLPINWFTSTTHLYLCDVIEGAPTGSAESREVGYFSLDHLPKELFPLHRHWVEEFHHVEEMRREPIRARQFWKMIGHYLFHPIWAIRYFWTRWSRWGE